MTTFLVTLLLTFALVLLAMFLFWKLGSPVYRVEKENIITLLEMIVGGSASEADWNVFAGYPIRHDNELALIQQRCLEIAEQEYVGGSGMLFSKKGIDQFAELLEKLKVESQKVSSTNR